MSGFQGKGGEERILTCKVIYIWLDFQPSEEITSLFLNSPYLKPKFFPSLCICFKYFLLWLERRASVVYIVIVHTVKWLPFSLWSFGKCPWSCVTFMLEGNSLAFVNHIISDITLFGFPILPHFSWVVFPYSSFFFQFSLNCSVHVLLHTFAHVCSRYRRNECFPTELPDKNILHLLYMCIFDNLCL